MEARQDLLGIPWGRPRALRVGLGRPRVVPRSALGSSWRELGVAGDALGSDEIEDHRLGGKEEEDPKVELELGLDRQVVEEIGGAVLGFGVGH